MFHGAAGSGIDGEDALSENDSLGLSDGFVGSVNLAVGIGETEIVEVDEGELPDSGAGEGFDGPGSNSAKSNDHDVSVGEALERSEAVKSGDASKAIEIVLGHRRILCPRCGLNKSEDSDNHSTTNNDDQRRCEQTEGICPAILSHDAKSSGGIFFAFQPAESP